MQTNQYHTSVNQIDTQSFDYTHLQTSSIWNTGPAGLKNLTRCLLDSGSQSSFIHTSLVDQLQLPFVGKRDVIITLFESNTPTLLSSWLVQFTLHGIWAKSTLSAMVFESAHIYSTHPTIPHDVSALHCTRNIRLADPNYIFPNPTIEVLLGGVHYWKLIQDDIPLRISPSLVPLSSISGWILSGNRSSVSVNHVAINNMKFCQDFDPRVSQLRRFWSLEAMCISYIEIAPHATKDTAMSSSFSDSFRIENGQAVVSLPKK